MRTVDGVGVDMTLDALTEDLHIAGVGADVRARVPSDETVRIQVSGTGADVWLDGDGTVDVTVSGVGGDVHIAPSLTIDETRVDGLSGTIHRQDESGSTERITDDADDDAVVFEQGGVRVVHSSSVTVNSTTTRTNDAEADDTVSSTVDFACPERAEAFERQVSTSIVPRLVQSYDIEYVAPCDGDGECSLCGERVDELAAMVTETGYAFLERSAFAIDRDVTVACEECRD